MAWNPFRTRRGGAVRRAQTRVARRPALGLETFEDRITPDAAGFISALQAALVNQPLLDAAENVVGNPQVTVAAAQIARVDFAAQQTLLQEAAELQIELGGLLTEQLNNITDVGQAIGLVNGTIGAFDFIHGVQVDALEAMLRDVSTPLAFGPGSELVESLAPPPGQVGAPPPGQVGAPPPGSSPTPNPNPTPNPTLEEGELIHLQIDPLDINLLGLQVQTSVIEVTVKAQPGEGKLLGNLLDAVGGLLNLEGVNSALNNVLDSVVGLVNSVDLVVDTGGDPGELGSVAEGTTQVLSLHVAPIHLDLLGAIVETSAIDVTITAHAGEGQLLGNVITLLSDLFNPDPTTGEVPPLNLAAINDRLADLLAQLNAAIPLPPAAPTTPPPTTGTEQVLSLTVPPIDLNLLGLLLKTDQITVNLDATTGDGLLLGNVVESLLNTVGATPEELSELSNNLNAVLAKVVGVLNASELILPAGALDSLAQVLQTLALPDLINTTGTPATAPILDLAIASPDGTTPPVDVDLLGLRITTSDINAQLLAQTGEGQVLGNLLYNVANLLNPDGTLNLLTILNQLAAL